MAIYKLYPTKDASIYSQYPDMNTGLDAILDASAYLYSGVPYVSRYLIQFSTNQITDVINSKISGSSFVSYLKNYAALVSGLTLDTTMEIHPVSQSWGMGTGHCGDNPEVDNGVSWIWRDYSGSVAWNVTGGEYYNSPAYTYAFDYENPLDISVDVTTTVVLWYSGSMNNNGFLLKLPDSKEFVENPNNNITCRYFSFDTNTIYPPQLEFKWVDYNFNTGSSTNTILSTLETFVSLYNNEKVYHSGSLIRFRIAAIPKYPTRSFQTSSYYGTNFYLPESQSLYALKDAETNDYVINFDSDYTRISADSTSSYFDLYTDGLEPERYYNVLIKTTIGGITKVFNEDLLFKIET